MLAKVLAWHQDIARFKPRSYHLSLCASCNHVVSYMSSLPLELPQLRCFLTDESTTMGISQAYYDCIL
jgi:hypothetical protein